MPTDTSRLTTHQSPVVMWVLLACAGPATVAGTLHANDLNTEDEHWSFQPIQSPPVPGTKITGWSRTPVDSFLLSRLEARRGRVAPAANRRSYLRRLTFNLTGLPPTPLELRAFEADSSPLAYERVVDRLLSSPRYGERWGRHWLDISRYADSNGLDENRAYVHAFQFRDYVIEAFNHDVPYDEFIRSLVAGDLLPEPSRPPGITDDDWDAMSRSLRANRIRATGFLSLGPKGLREVDPVKMEMDIIDDQVATVGKALLGLTLECARCHDHKFDPITTEDYYALAGIFKSTRTMRQIVDKRGKGNGFWLERSVALEHSAPGTVPVMSVEEGSVSNLRVHRRGSHLDLGPEVRRGLPAVLTQRLPTDAIGDSESGRLQLARWLTNPQNPLTSRVITNRIWQWHFGTGLVDTPDNFGELGAAPVAPELLDWLASELIRRDWSIKRLHRLILLSSIYRTAGRSNQDPTRADDDELPAPLRAITGFPRRRLTAEEIRDSLLFVSGLLDTTMRGSLLTLKPRQYVNDAKTGNHLVDYNNVRRSVYQPVIRNKVYSLFQTFEFPSPSLVSGKRATTTVPPQMLLMLNSDLVVRSSEGMAGQVLGDKTRPRTQRIRLAYETVYGREPADTEVRGATSFLEAFARTLPANREEVQRRREAWQAFCHALMVSNEFVYLD